MDETFPPESRDRNPFQAGGLPGWSAPKVHPLADLAKGADSKIAGSSAPKVTAVGIPAHEVDDRVEGRNGATGGETMAQASEERGLSTE